MHEQKRRRVQAEEERGRRINDESSKLITDARLIHEASTPSFKVVLSYNSWISRVTHERERERAQNLAVPVCNC